MRAIPIDDFLELAGARGADPQGWDWSRLVAEGRAARATLDRGAWRIGDLALLVERRYASRALRRFAGEIGESAGTVRRFRWVAGVYDEATRRRFDGLSFSHFQAAAGLPDRAAWLERARRGRWSVARLVEESRRGASTTRPRPAVLRPIEAAVRTLTASAEKLPTNRLSRADRESIARALGELERVIEAMRARLREPAALRLARNGARARRG